MVQYYLLAVRWQLTGKACVLTQDVIFSPISIRHIKHRIDVDATQSPFKQENIRKHNLVLTKRPKVRYKAIGLYCRIKMVCANKDCRNGKHLKRASSKCSVVNNAQCKM